MVLKKHICNMNKGLGKPYDQQPGRKSGKGAGHIVPLASVSELVYKFNEKYSTPVKTYEPNKGVYSSPMQHSRIFNSGGNLEYVGNIIRIPSGWSKKEEEKHLSVPERVKLELSRKKEFTDALESLLKQKGIKYRDERGSAYTIYTLS